MSIGEMLKCKYRYRNEIGTGMEAHRNIKQQLGESINRNYMVTLLLFLVLLVDLLM